jgi:hypothetical protein
MRSFLADGFLAIEFTRDENKFPSPTPTPNKARTAIPAPINFAAAASIFLSPSFLQNKKHNLQCSVLSNDSARYIHDRTAKTYACNTHTTILKTFSKTFIATGITAKNEKNERPARETAKLAITFIIICPETMFANNLNPKLIGLNKNDITSMITKSGVIYPGNSSGQKCLRYCFPSRTKPITIEEINTIRAIPTVTTICVVNEKVNGNIPIRFPNIIKSRRENIYGNIKISFFPQLVLTIFPAKKNKLSVAT